ncbi:MAG: hypothetical protein GTN78_07055 [Gemmatimonadales bacterium]|nr:hypothetical protein [Gemmatimonadales bacterium]
MSGAANTSKRSGDAETRCSRWIGRGALTTGLALAALSGLWVGRGWSSQSWLSWVVGGTSLLCGVLVAIVGLRVSAPHEEVRQYRPPQHRPRRRRERAVPYLGELLVHKYHLITEKQLQEALAEQRNRGGRLGQIMVAMGYLDYATLSRVLEDQVSYADPWRGVGGTSEQATTVVVRTR